MLRMLTPPRIVAAKLDLWLDAFEDHGPHGHYHGGILAVSSSVVAGLRCLAVLMSDHAKPNRLSEIAVVS